MAKLFYTPTSGAAASFIAAHVAGVRLDVEMVDLRTHTTASGADFYDINPKGNVPTLVLEDGTILNEGAAVLQWIADQKAGTIAPLPGTTARYLIMSALNYVASEVHPTIGGLFNPMLSEDVREYLKSAVAKKLNYLDTTLVSQKFLGGGTSASVADFYLHVVLSWTGHIGISLDPYPNVQSFVERVGGLQSVKAAYALMARNPPTTTG
eukprot:m.227007 g.227007  ORF g.227007 m.227007 type:complete len:209 (+) comp11516_c0_seq1:63-689(+)